MKATKIVITGGPCAGKSSALSHIKSLAEAHGYTVLTVAETATELIGGGVAPWTCKTNADYQACQMRLQIEKERVFLQAAAGMRAEKILIVCDRGLMDNRAYMTEEDFARVSRELSLTREDCLSAYDAVFHLCTAAKGAEAFYTTANNASRTETPAEARAVDDALIAAWEGHPYHRMIGNSGSFADKMAALGAALEEFFERGEGA